ncbi:MAG: MauE/DoxX family redox-associated membrane protein [Candidatus Neomarinimicrobiota bacterium]|nr:MauE/DoxX family redox-associated membrane protein [Candidatus Neomarinimicrobiota bacterium]MEC9006722.1 MauE/DoxX family redox-associated membrane protein [Candidatus Neomarinimicrobiota bacterium]MEC9475294.1 MauE/DoxX family redox-associated membrane protein [Candidatus Neomarinimicrobiota bacterium]|tara:strand:+ start:3553 stop:4005 length:453 start_codon:yes stop_codon:yes gene_type:complete
MMDFFKGPVVLISRLILGAVFIYASLDKIMNPDDFAKAIGNYHVLPFGLENLLALVLPWVELLTGLCLIIGVMVDGATVLIILMNIVFIFAISQALARGISIECGCFSVSSEGGDNIGLQTIIRDIGYLLLAYVVYYRQERKFEFFPKSD